MRVSIYNIDMIIKGLQKLTLLDYPGKLACTVFTAGCNFRCPFCHNASLVTRLNEDYISEEEFFTFLNGRKGKLDGVCVTGGEPTLQKDVIDFMRKIKDLGFCVKLDTNGYNPDVLLRAIDSGVVDYVAMDIKNSLESYPKTIGVTDFDPEKIKRSIAILKGSSLPYEFRTTVVKELHTTDDFRSIADLVAGADEYYLQTFKDSGDIIGEGLHPCTEEEMQSFARVLEKTIKNVSLRG